MSFGPIMRLKVGDLDIELAPIVKEDVAAFVSPGFQQRSISQYLSHHRAPVLEDEQEWFDQVRADKKRLVWGIYVTGGGVRKLIGNSSIGDIELFPLKQGETGVVISDKSYWGKGIASTIHRARTWYAFEHLGFNRLKSAVIYGNTASLKALEKVGYTQVYVERNVEFIGGELRHMDCLECLNPADWAWRRWWGDETPTDISLEARQRTLESMQWARDNIELP